MDVADDVADGGRDFGESEIVRRDDADRAALQQALDQALGADAAVF